MKQHKLFYRFFLVAIWLGMTNLSFLQAQTYLFEDFETAGGDVRVEDDHRQAPEGWQTYFLSDSTNNIFDEFFRFDTVFNSPHQKYPPPPIEGVFANYKPFLTPYNGLADNTCLESPEFDLPQGNIPIFLSFDHQHDYWNDGAIGLVELWNGTNWIEIYDTGMKDVGFNKDSLLNRTAIEHIHLNPFIQDLTTAKIRFRYLHTEATGGSWWILDNVKIFTPPPIDMGTIALQHPTLLADCYTENETIEVLVKNYGSMAVDFSEHPLQIHLETLGPKNQTYTQTLAEGILPMNDSLWVALTGVDLSRIGTYTIKTYPQIEGDTTVKNDSSYIHRTTWAVHSPPLPILDFDDFHWWKAKALGWQYGEERELPLLGRDEIPPTEDFAYDSNHPNKNSFSVVWGQYSDNVYLLSPVLQVEGALELAFDISLYSWASGSETRYLTLGSSIHIRISTDCGKSFETIHQIDDQHEFIYTGQTERFRITGYENQEIIVGIFIENEPNAPEDPNDSILSMDNISIQKILSRDISITPMRPFITGFYEDYTWEQILNGGLWECGDFNHPVQVKLVNHGAMLQNNFEVVGTISEGWNDAFSVLITQPLYPEEERIITLGTTNTYNAGQFDFTAHIRLPNDENHDNDTLNAFLLTVPPQPNAQFILQYMDNHQYRFDAFAQLSRPFYYWTFSDGHTDVGQNITHTFTANGTHTIELLVTDACGSNTHTETVVVDTVVGIEDIDLEQILTITPNPFNGSFAVKIEGRVIPTAHIQVFTANGQLVFQKNYTNFQETMISLNKYSSGLYFLQFATPSDIISLSFFHQ